MIDSEFVHAAEDLWVFGYGSLMWRPGFAFAERLPARIIGLHRALCVYSFVHRGLPDNPGLVLGLDRGGSCRGIAYRVAAARRAETIAYLREREQVTKVYIESLRPVVLAGAPERRVRALVYMVDRTHHQYAGALSLDEQTRLVRHAQGHSGANVDYVLATVAEIEAQGFRDHDLHELALRLRAPVKSTL